MPLRKLAEVEPPIDLIVRRIVESLSPQRVVLFGSRARGSSRPDSDVDLLIVMETPLAGAGRNLAVERLFFGRRWGMDVFVYTPEEARMARRWRNSLVAIAEREGKVLYSDGA